MALVEINPAGRTPVRLWSRLGNEKAAPFPDLVAALTCPFKTRPRTNERPHWTTPTLVAQLKFAEWTKDGLLRQSIYLGIRDDVKPESVRRDPESRVVHRRSSIVDRPSSIVRRRSTTSNAARGQVSFTCPAVSIST